MERRPLGGSGIEVSCVGYGTNMLGRPADPARPADPGCTTEAYYVRMVHAALDEGVNLFDTANSYQDGRSERLLGKALAGRREKAVIATKCGSRSRDFSAGTIRREAEASLGRLRTDWVDLLQLHNPPLEALERGDWREGMERLRREGKIRLGGVSVSNPQEGLWLVQRGLVEAVQVNFNLFRPGARDDLLPAAARAGVGVLAKVPLARGLLSGKYGSHSRLPQGDWHRQGIVGDEADMLARIDRLGELTRREGMTAAALALRWAISHAGLTAAIPGAKRVEHVRANARCGGDGPLPERLREAVERIAGTGAG